MRSLSDQWRLTLGKGVTTLCTCWKLIRQDGAIFGFTDHDDDLVLDQIVYSARTGLESSESESILGLSTTGLELSGILNSLNLNDSDLLNGLFDAASLEIWLVDWTNPNQRLLLDIGVLGEVTLTESVFAVEVRGLASAFDQATGRLYQAKCSADFGDQHCQINTDESKWTISAQILHVYDPSSFSLDLSSSRPGDCSNGKIKFLSGFNSAAQLFIKSHRRENEIDFFTLWTPPSQPLHIGDRVQLTIGCNKTYQTCLTQFNNIENFRGFPHMPGNDVLAFYPGSSDSLMDGRSLFK